jgi:hypothetical protein
MKKLFSSIVLLGLLWGANAYAEMATCLAGECEFFIGIWYEYGETNCMQSLIMEEVEQGPLGFTIVETGEYCMIFNER